MEVRRALLTVLFKVLSFPEVILRNGVAIKYLQGDANQSS